MPRLALAALLLLAACAPAAPAERYGFLTRLGRDTIAAESVTRTLGDSLAGGDPSPAPEDSAGAEQTVDWTGLQRRLEQLADAALPERSKKVKELLQATPLTRDSYLQTIDSIANLPILFIDPARLTTLAGKMRRALDQVTGG